MPCPRVVAALSICLAPALAAAQGGGGMTAEECGVWRREQAFAASVATSDAAAFEALIHPDAVFNAATAEPVRGRARIVEAWHGFLVGTRVKLAWRAGQVSHAAGSDVAISRGPYLYRRQDGERARYFIGNFVSVWTRSGPAAPWQVIYDGGGPPPQEVASEVEALRHLDTAPAACSG